MNIDVSRETERCLAEEARREGLTMEALLIRLMDERTALYRPGQSHADLPVLHLGSPGALHRRDIYDDVR